MLSDLNAETLKNVLISTAVLSQRVTDLSVEKRVKNQGNFIFNPAYLV